MDSIQQELKQYIIREFMFDKDASILDNDVPLIENGILDSLGIFALVAFIQERFRVTISHQDIVLENFKTINRIRDLISRKQQG
jgi:acyl carrier protein